MVGRILSRSRVSLTRRTAHTAILTRRLTSHTAHIAILTMKGMGGWVPELSRQMSLAQLNQHVAELPSPGLEVVTRCRHPSVLSELPNTTILKELRRAPSLPLFSPPRPVSLKGFSFEVCPNIVRSYPLRKYTDDWPSRPLTQDDNMMRASSRGVR